MKLEIKDKLLISVAVFVTLIAVLQQCGIMPVPKYGIAIVRGPSMTGTLASGDCCIVERVDDGDELSVGDIVIFNTPTSWRKYTSSKSIIHRIVYANENSSLYLTKGDGNPTCDPGFIKRSDIVYRTIAVLRWPNR